MSLKTKSAGKASGSAKDKKKKGPIREWLDAIVFAVVAATIIRWLLIEAFTIPTPSMERSLLVGDFLFVSKVHYGARTPKTPLQVPLTHQKIWGTDIPSYVDWIQLPQFRLPGFSDIENGDVVVFNWPVEEQYPTDLKTNYIKRCIAIPGDELKIVDKQIFINGEPFADPPNVQYSYEVYASEVIQDRVFRNLGINVDEIRTGNSGKYYIIFTNEEKAKKLEQYDFVIEVKQQNFELGQGSERIFPKDPQYNWSIDNFGPLYIPAAGETVKIDKASLPLYEYAILNYEGLDNARIENGKLYIDENAVSEYTFRQDYYFMMGDNRHDSEDSRVWGFVPQDHVLGKGLLIWWSFDKDPESGNIFTRVRWERIFNLIE